MVNSKIAHPTNMLHREVVGGCGRMVVGFTFTCIVSTY